MTVIKNEKTKSFLLIYWSFVFLGCLLIGGYLMAKEENQENIFVMSRGDETHITVNAPGEFSIKIESNPTTGYSWGLHTPKEQEDSLIKFKQQRVEEPGENSKPMLGAPTYEIFTFEALQPGEAVIRLHYRRPWEKEVPPIKKHTVYVTIE